MIAHPARDADGHEISGCAAGVVAFDDAVDALGDWDPAAGVEVARTTESDPAMAMGAVLATYHALGWHGSEVEPDDLTAARFDRTSVNEREAAHLLAATRWAAGDLWGASQVLSAISIEHPRDHLALLAGHRLDVATGNTRSLYERVGRVLQQLDRGSLRWARALGMWAFGMAEGGDAGAARAGGLEALDVNPGDRWALHAALHAEACAGASAESRRLLAEHRDLWLGLGGFETHLAWHDALCALDLGDPAVALALIDAVLDRPIAGRDETRVAAGLLWRLALEGHVVSARAAALVDRWPAPPGRLVLDDLHFIACAVAADRLTDAADRVGMLEDQASRPPRVTNDHMVQAAGLRVGRALLSFGQDHDDEVVEAFAEVAPYLNVLGGSSDELDTFERTWVVAARRGGHRHLHRALVSQRLSRRPAARWERSEWDGP